MIIAIPLRATIEIEDWAVASNALSGKIALVKADTIGAIIGQEVGNNARVALSRVYHIYRASNIHPIQNENKYIGYLASRNAPLSNLL